MRVERCLNTRQHRAVKRLIRAECCNHYEGRCLPTDRPCAQIRARVLGCKWFYKAVLPRDKALWAELTAIQPTPVTENTIATCTAPETKSCAFCGQEFTPASNRAKYCSACASIMRREQKRQHEQKRRDRRKGKESA